MGSSRLDEAGLQQLRDAEAAVEWLRRLEADETARTTESQTTFQGTHIQSATAQQDNEAELKGSEHDPRWADVEFNVDLLRSRSHQFAQLESLANRYVRTVSAHAAKHYATALLPAAHLPVHPPRALRVAGAKRPLAPKQAAKDSKCFSVAYENLAPFLGLLTAPLQQGRQRTQRQIRALQMSAQVWLQSNQMRAIRRTCFVPLLGCISFGPVVRCRGL